jgi:hypothetical protein
VRFGDQEVRETMATTLTLRSPGSTDMAAATAATPATAQAPESGFEIEMPGGATSRFASKEDIRAAILRGEIPRTARVRPLDATANAGAGDTIAWSTVEAWARSHATLRRLYTPVWALALKGAFVGVIGVAILKALDTLVALLAVNPGLAVLWLLVGAGIFSPKHTLHFMAASIFFSLKIGASLMSLWASWVGVGLFAVVFGATAGTAIGTAIGFLRSHDLERAPDATSDGRKPLLLGLALPSALFVAAAVAYVQVFVPVMSRALE